MLNKSVPVPKGWALNFAHALMMTSPVKILCRKMIVMNILMTMMKVTIAMIVQVMMMKTINVVNYVFITLLMGD